MSFIIEQPPVTTNKNLTALLHITLWTSGFGNLIKKVDLIKLQCNLSFDIKFWLKVIAL